MLYRVKMPKLAETTDVLVVEEWLVKVGDTVAENQPLAMVETDKISVELPSPIGGVVSDILVAGGDEARTGEQICVIEA